MSTTYEIIKFSRPKKKELKTINCYEEYARYNLTNEDGYRNAEFIRLFRSNDKDISNLVGGRFAVPMELPQIMTDYEKLYRALGFAEESIKNHCIRLVYGNSRYIEYSDEIQTKRFRFDMHDRQDYEKKVLVKCIAIKMETLWTSEEGYVYVDGERVRRFIPDIDQYQFVQVSNSKLAKAEIPFLIFEKNRGKCFLERY
ncbi:MAG: hypothetical protein LUI87_01790 [Lachnospiraceae bacterium]|nr:hypothetical protein [Lachnospiraceae bacterium]